MYHDYRYRFLASNVAQAVAVLSALRAAGVLDGEHPTNMLGDPLDATGNPTSLTNAAFLGRRGRAAVEYEDENGDPQVSPAAGDPDYIYLHVRATTPPSAIGVDLSAYGMEPVSEAESAAVLGVWF